MKKFKMGKLVRDNMVNILSSKGITVSDRTMNTKEYQHHLKIKLIEEAHEVIDSQSPDELLEELADLSEVIRALAEANAISTKQIEEARARKQEQKGGFDQRIYISHVEMPSGHSSINYYLDRPEKYPQQES